jgi:hypothetical protein
LENKNEIRNSSLIPKGEVAPLPLRGFSATKIEIQDEKTNISEFFTKYSEMFITAT